jgi:hypothetical protein
VSKSLSLRRKVIDLIGVSLCTQINSIDALKKITRVNMGGLILQVSLIEGHSLDFGLVLSTDKAVSMLCV